MICRDDCPGGRGQARLLGTGDLLGHPVQERYQDAQALARLAMLEESSLDNRGAGFSSSTTVYVTRLLNLSNILTEPSKA